MDFSHSSRKFSTISSFKGSKAKDVHCTRREVFFILKDNLSEDLKTQITILENGLSAAKNVSVKIHEDVKADVKKMVCSLKKRWAKANRTSKYFLQNNKTWLDSDINIANAYACTSPMPKPTRSFNSTKVGRPSMDFNVGSDRTKRKRTEEVRKSYDTDELAYATQMSLRSSGLNDAASVVRDVTSSSPSRASKYKSAVKHYEMPRAKELSQDAALSLVIEGKMTKFQYNLIRQTGKNNNSPFLPAYYTVLEAKKRCYPTNITITETSAEVKLQSLLDHTTERILKVQNDVIKSLDANIVKNLSFILKWGCDGSSNQSLYKQTFSDKSSSDENVFLTSLVQLQISATDNLTKKEIIVWKNPRPSSPRFCRPIRLQFLHENVQSIINEKKYIDEQISSLIPFKTFIDGKRVTVDYKLVFTMIDGKVCNAVTSTKSTLRCYLCKRTSKDFNDIDLILKQNIDTSILELGLSTLHAWIHFFECLLHVAEKLGIKKWQARKEDGKKNVADRKAAFQEGFRERLGLLIDFQKHGYGSTNDGNTARRFFEYSSVSAEILGIDEDIIHRFHVILQVLSSCFPVKMEQFQEYCIATARMLVDKYPWYCMPTTVHKVLLHGPEIIKTALLPIGQLSEDAQESRNKDIKKYREGFSRKCSREKTMEDVFNRLLMSSDPLISSLRKTPPKASKALSSEAIQLLLPPHANQYATDNVTPSTDDSDDSLDLDEIV